MLWQDLREEQFTKAIEDFGGLCVLPLTSLEKHGQHLPVGADGYIADAITFNGMQNLKYPNIVCPAVPEGCTKSIGQAVLKLNAEALAAAFKLLKTDEECMRIANGIPMGQK